MTKKEHYITEISNMSDRYGDKLLSLMDKYKANSLQEITEQQAEEYLNQLRKDKSNDKS